MKVAVAFDHRGVRLREAVLAGLAAEMAEAVDLGVWSTDVRVDYPDLAREVGTAIRSGRAERGVLVCGSGVGASIAASKIPGIRALVGVFLGAAFVAEGRYLARLEMVEELERLVEG